MVMTTTTLDQFYARREAVTLTLTCEKCGAKSGEGCRTVSGLPTLTFHLKRRHHGYYLHSLETGAIRSSSLSKT